MATFKQNSLQAEICQIQASLALSLVETGYIHDVQGVSFLPIEGWMTGKIRRGKDGRFGSSDSSESATSEASGEKQKELQKDAQKISKDAKELVSAFSEANKKLDQKFNQLPDQEKQQLIVSFAPILQKANQSLAQKMKGENKNIAKGIKESKSQEVEPKNPFQAAFDKVAESAKGAIKAISDHSKEIKIGAMIAGATSYGLMFAAQLAQPLTGQAVVGIAIEVIAAGLATAAAGPIGGAAILAVMKVEQIAINKLAMVLIKKLTKLTAKGAMAGQLSPANLKMMDVLSGGIILSGIVSIATTLRNFLFLTLPKFQKDLKADIKSLSDEASEKVINTLNQEFDPPEPEKPKNMFGF